MNLSTVALGMLLSVMATVIVFFSVVKASLGVTGSLLSAILSYLVLSSLHRAGWIFRFDHHVVNLAQTAASAGGAVAMSSLFLLALVIMGVDLQPLAFFMYLVLSGLLGVVISLPMRYQFVCKERLPFPSGTACREIIEALFDRARSKSRARLLLAGTAWGVGQKLAVGLGWIKSSYLLKTGGGVHAKLLAGFSTEPLLIGVGMIVGVRIGVTLGIAGALIWLVGVPFLVDIGYVDSASYGSARSFLVYPAIAWMFSAGMVQFYLSLRMNKGFDAGEGNERICSSIWIVPYRSWVSMLVLMALANIVLLYHMGVGVFPALVAVAGSFLLAFVASKSLGSTDISPLSTLSNVMLFVQSKLGVSMPVLPSSTTTVVSSLASDTLQDFKTGYLLGTDPKRQVLMQVIGVVSGAFALACLFTFLLLDGRIVLGSEQYPAATSVAVSELARVLSTDAAFPEGALMMSALAFVLGGMMAYAEFRWADKGFPSVVVIGVAMILPLFYGISIMIGAMLAWGMRRAGVGLVSVMALGAGLIMGDSLVGLFLAFAGAH